MNSDPPTVSVLMTTYKNTFTSLRRSIDSILEQTLDDLELIVILEPADENLGRLRTLYDDPRLVLSENETRLGRCRSYNRGLAIARGRYLARMDADDYAYPQRLDRQIAFLKAHPEISVVGSNARVVDGSEREVGFRQFPESHADIVKTLAFINPMLHPTIVWDREKVGHDLRFDERFSRYCDDLELWMRLIAQGHKFVNLPEALLDYQQADRHQRPSDNWRLNLHARLVHWRLAMRHPRLVLGMAVMAVLAIMPAGAVNALTARNAVSDRVRHIRSLPNGKASSVAERAPSGFGQLEPATGSGSSGSASAGEAERQRA